jgi:hypothetical protein
MFMREAREMAYDLTISSDDLFYIVSQEDQPSRHGGYITEIKFISLGNGQEYHTYVDENNRNYKYWYDIVQHPLMGWVITNLKQKSQRDSRLISADSRPKTFVCEKNIEQLEKAVTAYLNQEVYKITNPLFQQGK